MLVPDAGLYILKFNLDVIATFDKGTQRGDEKDSFLRGHRKLRKSYDKHPKIKKTGATNMDVRVRNWAAWTEDMAC